MTKTEESIVAVLEKEAESLREQFEAQGGRGIALAEHIDRIERAIDSLKGELFCSECGRQLTGNA